MISETSGTKNTNCRIGEGGLRTKGKLKKNHPNTPLLTVITAVFNGAQHLEESILSVLNQTYNNVEYIIIDGGSTDGSLDIIHQYESRIDYWVSEKDSGIANAWNKALMLMLGEWFIILGADDYFWDKSVLNEFSLKLNGSSSSSLIRYGEVNFVNEDRMIVEAKVGAEFFLHKFLSRPMYFSHQSVFCHTKLREEVGFFNENLRTSMDYNFILKATKFTSPEYMPDFIVAGFRIDGISSSCKNILNMYYEIALVKKKNGYGNLQFRFIFSIFKAIIKYIIHQIFGDAWRKRAVNIYRILTGRLTT